MLAGPSSIPPWMECSGEPEHKIRLCILCRAQLLVKGCVKHNPRAEGRSDASLGFPFLIIMLVSVHEHHGHVMANTIRSNKFGMLRLQWIFDSIYQFANL